MIACVDVETTGLDIFKHEICQLTYICFNKQGIQKVFNQFYAVDAIDPKAAAVNGFSVESLRNLSGGARFSHRAHEAYTDLKSSSGIAHNIAFDEKFISNDFSKQGISFKFGRKFCTMEYFTDIIKIPGGRNGYKWPKLQDVLTYCGIRYNEVHDAAITLFNDSNGAHDARFDTTALYLITQKLIQAGVIEVLD